MTIAEMQTMQIRREGNEPVMCGACEWPGHVIEKGKDTFLIRHLGRGFPCRTSSAEPIPDLTEDILEDPT
jgi:hypothetical protein